MPENQTCTRSLLSKWELHQSDSLKAHKGVTNTIRGSKYKSQIHLQGVCAKYSSHMLICRAEESISLNSGSAIRTTIAHHMLFFFSWSVEVKELLVIKCVVI